MSIWSEKDKRFAINSVFPSLFFSALATVLGQAGSAQMHASWRVHGVLVAPGLVLSGLSLFRARLHWPAVGAAALSRSARHAGWYLALFAVGTLFGVFVSAGSVLLIGVAAALMYLLPWMKLPVCRGRFVVSALVMLGGTLAWGVACARSIPSTYLMMAAWILYLPPTFMHLLVLLSLERGYRIEASALTDKPSHDAHAVRSPD